ncbi:hypothetical protein, partial [Elizabethkingia meningoseptica]|uniref:hypothetical protein n=1 Tax=Elizabethkingia meningoseptica TaxID=238 RepID=UPI003158942E
MENWLARKNAETSAMFTVGGDSLGPANHSTIELKMFESANDLRLELNARSDYWDSASLQKCANQMRILL